MLTFALSKGRLADKILDMLRKLELCDLTIEDDDRRLVVEAGNYRFYLAKPSDVPTFVDSGVADLGVVGKDTVLEENRDITQVLDLGFGKCRMCVCGKVSDGDKYKYISNLRVATKYPHIAKEYFDSIDQNTTIIKLNGSVELGPVSGLSDVIVDIVESGRTLKENGLEVKEVIHDLSARLVANNASLKTKYEEISEIIKGFEKLVKE
ncbi:MAG: ATP phosphoribosyltransferase [Acholeplasmatales bacterium]|nr:ATP phosphoribosyltransferase [Acholeplasmatales bacterium]MBQ6782731.1 ATP phosphoribosyltransferase [Acholeplasmatales bacterium]MBR6288313.1 ATP phosphoribosyltransferase [Acholeplasmatales bacterium]